MSITKAREIIEKPGCGLTVGIVLVLVFAIGFILQGQFGAQQAAQQEAGARTPIATIGDFVVLDEAVRMQEAFSREQFAMFRGNPNPVQESEIKAQALAEVVQKGLRLQLGKDKGIQPSDADIKKTVDMQVETDFMRMAQQSGIPPQQFEQRFKEQTGLTLAEAKKKELEARAERLATDPDFKSDMASLAIDPLLKAAEAKKIKATDADVLKSNATLYLKPIQIDPAEGTTPKQKADKVLAEIRAGLSFEAAMDKYSDYAVAAGKKKSTAESQLSMQSVLLDERLAPLKDLKPGQVSSVVDVGSVALIYKLVKVENLAKKEFDKNKKMYTDRYVNTLASKSIGEQIEKLYGRIKWESEGYKLLFEAARTARDPKLTPTAMKARFKKIAADASQPVDEIGQDAADAARLFAGSMYWQSATPAEKQAMRKERIAMLREVAEGEIDLMLELIDLLIAEKDPDAGTFVLSAVQTNQDFDDASTANIKKITERFAKAKAAKLVTPEDAKSIQDQLDLWKKEKQQDDLDKKKQAEEDRKLQEAEKKQQEQDERARKAAEKKAKDEAKPQPRPKGSTTR